MSTSRQHINFRVLRQEGPNTAPYWEAYRLPYRPNMNVISVLMEVQRHPVTAEGKTVSPPVWDAACLEEVCGSCTMNIEGKVRQSCTALIDNLPDNFRIEPMKKFPVIRDLRVDRSRMFDALKRVKAWIPVDGYYDLGEGPRQPPQLAETRYELSTCMTCGCCLEACPQVNAVSPFIGAAPIAQALLFNLHPTGKAQGAERVEALLGPGGLEDCGNAQNCVEVCPKEIPLVQSIAEMNKQATLHAFRHLFSGGK